MSLVELTRDGGIRTITLNVPERLNALDLDLLGELAAAVAEVAADDEARVLVVTGEGRAFCAGANLHNLFGDRTRPAAVLREHLGKVYAGFLGIRELKIPTIAAVQGAAVGAGLNIALACDVIVAGPKAAFGPTFSAIGLHPGGGCTWMLTQRIGAANTAAALFSGAVIRTEEALRLGLAQEAADDAQARAAELAATYAERNPRLMRDIKTAVKVASTSDFATTLTVEGWAQSSSMTNPELDEFLENFGKK